MFVVVGRFLLLIMFVVLLVLVCGCGLVGVWGGCGWGVGGGGGGGGVGAGMKGLCSYKLNQTESEFRATWISIPLLVLYYYSYTVSCTLVCLISDRALVNFVVVDPFST